MTVKVHSGLCMKYSRWDIYNVILSFIVLSIANMQIYMLYKGMVCRK